MHTSMHTCVHTSDQWPNSTKHRSTPIYPCMCTCPPCIHASQSQHILPNNPKKKKNMYYLSRKRSSAQSFFMRSSDFIHAHSSSSCTVTLDGLILIISIIVVVAVALVHVSMFPHGEIQQILHPRAATSQGQHMASTLPTLGAAGRCVLAPTAVKLVIIHFRIWYDFWRKLSAWGANLRSIRDSLVTKSSDKSVTHVIHAYAKAPETASQSCLIRKNEYFYLVGIRNGGIADADENCCEQNPDHASLSHTFCAAEAKKFAHGRSAFCFTGSFFLLHSSIGWSQ
jgi:hypothetical protein